MKKISIVICNRYHTCAGGKCLRSLREREGAFARYRWSGPLRSTCASVRAAGVLSS